MRRLATWTICLLIFVCTVYAQQSKLSIRAASDQPVEGWQKMQVEHSNRVAWVSPVEAVTASDIQEAHPELRSSGDTVIHVVFTDAGAKKMHDLTAAQFRKYIALIVDEKVIWAPMVMYVNEEAAKDNVLSGSTQQGLTQEEVQRIMDILR